MVPKQTFPVARTPVATHIAEHGWTSTPLGPVGDWPAVLRITVDIMLSSPTPKFLVWGDDLTFLYNDAYLPILGAKHPAALGKSMPVIWAEVWPEVRQLVERAWKGESFFLENVPFKLERDAGQTAWISFSYTPLYDDGAVAGILCELFETTQRIIDERAKAEESRRLHTLFNESPGMVAILHGPEHVFVSANRNYCAFAGERELLGRKARDALPEFIEQGLLDLLDTVYRTGEAYTGEAVPVVVDAGRDKPPRHYFISFVYQPIRNEAGEIQGIFAEGFDVTGLVQSKRALEESELRLHQLANTIPQLAWMADAGGSITWYNDRWYEYTGTVESEMAGWGWQTVHHPSTLPDVMTTWTRSLELGIPFEMTFPLRSKDGSYRPFLTLVAPLKNANGEIMQWFGTNTDVSSLHAIREALHKTEQWLADGLAAGRMVVWEWDLQTGHVKYSDNSMEVLGYATGDASKGWASIHPDDVQDLKDAVDRAIADRAEFSVLTRRVRPDDGRPIWIESKGRVMCDDAGNASSVRGIMVDQTTRMNAEHELTEANRRKDEFLAMLAHELRNPLAPISTAAQLLLLASSNSVQVARAGEIIVRQVRHMTELVDDLLDVSRVTRGLVQLDRESVDLKTVLAAAVEQARPLIESRSHVLNTRAAAASAWVHGDRTRLIQVVSNLLNNAAKYTPQHGLISVAIEAGPGQAIISVSDNGSGIDPVLLPHIFDLFSQAERTPDRSQGGLGLGLALVKSIVTLHGGTVQARSAGSGKGTTVTVGLPLSPQPLPTGSDLGGEAQATARRSLRVVIVDDNEDAAELLAALMRACGHAATVYFDAQAALSALSTSAVATDVFILDIGLPIMDGHELARQLRLLPGQASALLIALTGYGQGQDKILSKAAGFDHHLVKPVEIPQLQRILQLID